MQRCTSCKRCTEECPFGAIEEDEKGTPFFKINRCRRCGTCMGACPERIVFFKDLNVDIIGSAIKAVDVPEIEDEDDPQFPVRIIGLICENDAMPALDAAALHRLKIDPTSSVHPAALPGFLRHGVDPNRPEQGGGRHDPPGLQVRRRLPVPLRQGQRAVRLPAHQAVRNPGQAGTGSRPGAAVPDRHLRFRQTPPDAGRLCGPGAKKSAPTPSRVYRRYDPWQAKLLSNRTCNSSSG